MSVYLYGVTRADLTVPAGLRGVGDPPSRVRRLVAGPLAAVVGPVPDRLRARRRDLHAHQDLLMALADAGPVLPARFGVVADGDEDVLARLRAEPDAYLAALERVAGCVEMNLKVSPAEGGLADLVREDRQVARLRQEVRRRPGYEANLRLGEAVVAALRRRAAGAGQEVAAALGTLAEDVRPGPDVPGCVLNLCYLVPAARVAECRTAVDDLSGRFAGRADLRLTGPLPCYSFSAARPVAAGA